VAQHFPSLLKLRPNNSRHRRRRTRACENWVSIWRLRKCADFNSWN